MPQKRFIWRGPPTAIEIWNAEEAKPEWSGFVETDAEIPRELDPESEQVANWLAFGLIKPAEQPAETRRSRRENAAQEENTANG
jgi:hypothetical protein